MSTLTSTDEAQAAEGSAGSSGGSSASGASKAKKPRKREMSDEHKAAIVAGRVEASAVAEYLDALDANRPRPGRKQNPETLQAKLKEIDDQLEQPGLKPITRLLHMQERREVEQALITLSEEPDMSTIETGFVDHAKSYSDRKGIEYATWREFGVPADVLMKAGIERRR